VAVKIRLVRLGKIRTPHYRIVIADSRKARNGLKIEEIGRYSPASEPSLIEVDSDRAQHWLKNGAQPTPAVEAILKVTGDWQKFKGIAGQEGTLKPADGATTMKKRAAEKLAAKSAPVEVVAEAAPVEASVEQAPVEVVAEAAPIDTPVVDAPAEAVEEAAPTETPAE
jgi:small subunit ribosomal protein S16